MRITAKHPIRTAISDLPTYFECKGDALQAITAVCRDHDLSVDHQGMPGSEGSAVWVLRAEAAGHYVCACCDEKMDRAVFYNGIYVSWYTMCTGRIEIVAYVT
jgi:hypothetical protein